MGFFGSQVQEKAVDKVSDMMIGSIANGTQERDQLLRAYNEQVKEKITGIVNQHKILGAIAGPLPTHGILTTLNMIVLYSRLSSVVDIKVMQQLDDILAKALSSVKWSFVKLAVQLAVIKQVVSVLDETVIAAPLGIIIGLYCGYRFTHRAGLKFADKVSEMVNEAALNTPYTEAQIQMGYVQGNNMIGNQGGMNFVPVQPVLTPQSIPTSAGAYWTCSCGQVNTGKFCTNCGAATSFATNDEKTDKNNIIDQPLAGNVNNEVELKPISSKEFLEKLDPVRIYSIAADERFYSSSDVEAGRISKKINKFISVCAKKIGGTPQINTIVGYYDSTMFGGGDTGMLVTYDGLWYLGGPGEDNFYVGYAEVKGEIRYKKGLITDDVIIETNKGKFKCQLAKADGSERVRKAFFDAIAYLLESYRQR